jgi:hypothetical protein
MDEKNNEVILPAQNEPGVTAAPAAERLSDADMLSLERANNKRQLALSNAKAATSEAEAAELTYKTLILQLFLKHGLTQEDVINPDGTIRRGAKVG